LGIDSSLTTNTYNWYKNGVYYNTTTVNNISIPKIAITDTGSYSCIITNQLAPNLTLYSNPVRLTIGNGPQISKQPVSLVQCAGTKATFSVTATGTGLKYQWQFNEGNIPGATTASYSINNISYTNSGNYDVVVTDFNNKSETSNKATLTVNSLPVVTLGPLAPKVCSGSSQVMTATIENGTSPYTSSWTGTGTSASSATNTISPTFLDSIAGTYGLTYKVTDANNCSSSAVSTTITNIKIKTSISSPSVFTFCTGVSNRITAAASGGTAPYAYSWMGTGSVYLNSLTTINPQFNGSTPGIYSLTFTATDANGCTGSITITITVNGSPSATISPLSPKVCAGAGQVMTATITGGTTPYTSSWTGTGATALSATNITNPTFLDTTSGTYGLTYKVTDANNCSSSAVSTTITDIKIKTSISSPSVFSFCKGIATRITAAANDGTAPYTYSWTGTGSGYLDKPATINPQFTGTAPGSYSLTFTATDANGCTGNITINITVNGTPSATISPLTPKVCSGSGQVMTATITGGTTPYTSSWTGTGSTALSATNITSPTFLDTTSGTYGLTYKVTDANNCSSSDVSTTITNIKVKASISSPAAFVFCEGSSTTITGAASGGTAPYTYAWTGSGSGYLNKTTTINPKYTATTPGSYNLTFTATDANGCKGSITINITVPSPTANATNNGPVCTGNTLTLFGGDAGMANYAWTGPNGFTSSAQNPTVSTNANTAMAGTYTLTASNGSCTSTTTTTVTINTVPSVTAFNNGPVCAGDKLTVYGTAGFVSYTWSGPNDFTSNGTNQNVIVSESAISTMAGKYILTANNGICSNTDSTTVIINPLPSITTGNNGPVTIGSKLTLTGEPAGMANYSWSGPNGFASSVQSPTVATLAITAMSGIYTLTASNGTCFNTASTTVTVNSLHGFSDYDGEEPLYSITGPDGNDISDTTVKYKCSEINWSLGSYLNSDIGTKTGTTWSIDGSDKITINKTTGELTIDGAGSATITATIEYTYDTTIISSKPTQMCDCSACTGSCTPSDQYKCGDYIDSLETWTELTNDCVTADTTTKKITAYFYPTLDIVVTDPELENVTISNAPFVIGLNKPYILTTTISPSCADGSVTWSSDNEAVSINKNSGELAGVGCGTAIITVTSVEDPSITNTCSVTVQPVTGVTIDRKPTSDINLNDTFQLSATVLPDTACNLDVKWSSSDPAVVNVTSDGLLTGKGCGTATITAATEDANITATCDVTVDVPVTGLTLDSTVMTVTISGPPKQLKAIITPTDTCNDKIKWTSSNSNVATVDINTGLVSGVSCDTATITAISIDENKSASCVVTVRQPVTGITLSDTLITLRITKTSQIFDTIYPAKACNQAVLWSSSDTTVAKVDSIGNLTVDSIGSAIITATTVDGHFSASCKVIGELLVTLSQTSVTLNVKDTTTLIAIITPSSISNKTVTWKSTNPTIATVDSSGNVTAISGGTTYIIVRSNANPKVYASCVVNVRPKIVNITIQNSENQPNTDFIAGRGSIITITGSGFGNTQLFNSNKGYVSFTNADQGGLVSSYLIDKNSHRKTSMIDDYDSCDYTTPNGNVWSDSLIQMYLPSTIYANNIIINDTIQPEGIGSGHVTVTNNAIITDSSNYQITIPHAYIAVFSRKLKNKYPILLKNNTFTYTYGPGLANFDPKGITLINRAMKEWSCRNNINDTLVRTSSNSTDTIYFAPLSNSSALASTQIIQGNLYSDGYYYPSSTRITINTLYTSNNSQYKFNYKLPDNNIGTDSFDFYHVILHELGHALGLAHINDSLSLMYYSTPPGLKYNQRIDLRNKAGEPENYTDQTNAVQDANFIVTTSEQSLITGKLAPFTPGNCGPLAPSGLIAAVKSAGNINLRWTSASDMDYYTLTRTDLFGNQVQLYITDGAPIGAGTAIYRDLSVSPGATYTYNLTSINSFGYASTITQSISTPLLAKPGIIQTSATTSNNVTISWTGNANTYTILRSSDEGQTYETIATGDTTTTYTDNTVTPGATYTYKVQGNITNTLKESDPVTVTACLAIISKTTYSSSTIIYPCNNSIEFINDTIKNNSNVRVNGSSNKVNIQGKFQVQKGSSFYAK